MRIFQFIRPTRESKLYLVYGDFVLRDSSITLTGIAGKERVSTFLRTSDSGRSKRHFAAQKAPKVDESVDHKGTVKSSKGSWST